MKKYIANINTSSIREAEILRQTDKFVVVLEHRYDSKTRESKVAKETVYEKWCDSYEEAVQFLLDDVDMKITKVNQKLSYLENIREKIMKLK